MRIYLASSWKNHQIVKSWAAHLRDRGHKVDAFCDDSNGRFIFDYREIGKADELDAINFMDDYRTRKAFQEDKKWLDWADACLLILPAGKSSYLEAGYIKGQGKYLVIWQNEFPKGEFDVMYGFADLITDSHTAVDYCFNDFDKP